MDASLLPLAYLLPIGIVLAAWGTLPRRHLRESAVAATVAMVASAVAYLGFGFALQFGAVGLGPTAPDGLKGLDTAWSPFPAGAGQWTFAGLEGFFVSAQGTPGSLELTSALALHRLPLALAAGLIPVVALGERVNRAAMIAAGIVSSAIGFPVAGSWVWGGGWLAALGIHLNLGHGAIDVAGSGVTFLTSACVAFVALRLAGRRIDDETEPRSPTASHSLFAVLGALSFGAGWSAWIASDPLVEAASASDPGSVMVTGLIGAAAGLSTMVAYFWLATGRMVPLAVTRGLIAGWVAIGASAWFIPPGSAIAIGFGAGVVSIMWQAVSDRLGGMCDRGGTVAIYGATGIWGLMAVGLFADGAFGAGWNGVAVAHGVRGLVAADPGQLTAQFAAAVAIGLFALGAAAALLTPIALAVRVSGRIAHRAENPTPAESAPNE